MGQTGSTYKEFAMLVLKCRIKQLIHFLSYFGPLIVGSIVFVAAAYIALTHTAWPELVIVTVTGLVLFVQVVGCVHRSQEWRLYALMLEADTLHARMSVGFHVLKDNKPN
jgi:hypothetical protein